MTTIAKVLVGCALISTSLAWAQPEREPARAVKVRVQHHDFGDSTIDGTRDAPVIDLAVIPERPAFKRRVVVRASFANELHRSVDCLR